MLARNADTHTQSDLGHTPSRLIQDILMIIKKVDAFRISPMSWSGKRMEPEHINPNNERKSHD